MSEKKKHYNSISHIDEFPNTKMKNEYLVQEFFDERCSSGNSTVICSQASPEKWVELFEIRSFGESIGGRLQEKAIVLEMKGPDLRLFKPCKDRFIHYPAAWLSHDRRSDYPIETL